MRSDSKSGRLVLAAFACAMLAAGAATGLIAQTPSSGQAQAGAQVEEPPTLALPEKETWLGTVRIPRAVLADGKPLPAGRYRVRLTTQHAEKDAVGQVEQLERWVEFVQGGEVKGRELAPVVPSKSVPDVAEAKPPAAGRAKVEQLKEGDDYVRLWFNHRGDQILIYLPYAPAG